MQEKYRRDAFKKLRSLAAMWYRVKSWWSRNKPRVFLSVIKSFQWKYKKVFQVTLLKRERWKISNNVVHTSSNAHIVGKRMQRLRNNWQVDNLCTVVNHVNVFQSPESEILPTCEFNLTLSRFNFVKSQRREWGKEGATNFAARGKAAGMPPQTPFHTSAQESHLCNGAHPSLRMSSGLTRHKPESRRPRG